MPGGCQGKDACDAYCEDETNREECTAFALENGLITQEELDRMMPQGDFTGPGGCISPEECRTYCEQETNFEECSSFFGGEMEGEPRKQEFNEMEEFKQDFELRQDFEDREFDPGEFEAQEGTEFHELLEPEYREFVDEGAQRVYDEMAPDFKPDEIEGSESSGFDDFREPGEYQAPYVQEPYQYEGGQEDTQIHYDEGDVQDGFGGFDPGEYELDLGGDVQGDTDPQAEGGGESDTGGTDSQSVEPQSLAPNDANASFVRSVKRFFSRVTSQAKEFLLL
ncbi:MAG: hypothetical protein UY76_C0063G0003 [Candidatus Uhrbacteria bacterium GW2011_GWA2_52_8d]|uniref:Uncharacterized protein n=1 Tax=Candidatus Uhrbacteria bacterium GW2011_GWA2_52_8d TaxID=1618979 RepID=A0A0G2AFG8_9BACT|nr:MAG: hypothetical protein UY76_C0063G0003 [Candidatus Uhrbacteria bacterium GW2011_GWA2_52_8d]